MDVKRYSGDEVYGLYRGDLDERMVGTKDGEWMRFKQFNALREQAERLAEALEKMLDYGNSASYQTRVNACRVGRDTLAAYRKDHPKEQGR